MDFPIPSAANALLQNGLVWSDGEPRMQFVQSVGLQMRRIRDWDRCIRFRSGDKKVRKLSQTRKQQFG